MVIYPDGVKRATPRDGALYVYNGYTWTWDDMMQAWVRTHGGDIESFKEKVEPVAPIATCECGATKHKFASHSHWCPVGVKNV